MKKARIMVAVIAAFALIGGTLAFKANNLRGARLYCTTQLGFPGTTSYNVTTTAVGFGTRAACSIGTLPITTYTYITFQD